MYNRWHAFDWSGDFSNLFNQSRQWPLKLMANLYIFFFLLFLHSNDPLFVSHFHIFYLYICHGEINGWMECIKRMARRLNYITSIKICFLNVWNCCELLCEWERAFKWTKKSKFFKKKILLTLRNESNTNYSLRCWHKCTLSMWKCVMFLWFVLFCSLFEIVHHKITTHQKVPCDLCCLIISLVYVWKFTVKTCVCS